MDAVEGGETILVTRDGVPTAVLKPVGSRRAGVPTDELKRRFAGHPRVDYAAMRAQIEDFFISEICAITVAEPMLPRPPPSPTACRSTPRASRASRSSRP